jgi:hypothetical protein
LTILIQKAGPAKAMPPPDQRLSKHGISNFMSIKTSVLELMPQVLLVVNLIGCVQRKLCKKTVKIIWSYYTMGGATHVKKFFLEMTSLGVKT